MSPVYKMYISGKVTKFQEKVFCHSGDTLENPPGGGSAGDV